MTTNERDLRGPSHVLLDGPDRAPRAPCCAPPA